MTDVDAEARRTTRPYLVRLERLVVTLLGKRFKDANGIWQVQVALRALERDVQAEITRTKKRPRLPAKAATLERLREMLWHARRFGDAYAWLLLRSDRQAIYPLAENSQRVPVPPDDHSTRGLDAVVSHLASEGYGFPILHDVTHLLRVGDVTFVKGDEPPITAEVKTHVVRSKPSGTGTLVEYQVTVVVGDEELPARMRPGASRGAGQQSPDEAAPSPRRVRSMNKRVGKQLARLRRASRIRAAAAGSVIEVEGERPTLSIIMDSPTSPHDHWRVLRRLARTARKDGYATATVQGAIMYAAFYELHGEALSATPPLMERMPQDLIDSGILWPNPPEGLQNSIVLYGIPDTRGDGPPMYMPYYLAPLPRWAVLDMLRGRLGFAVVLNVGRLAAAIQARGLTVEMPRSDREQRLSPMWVSRVVDLPDGTQVRAGIGGLHLHLTEMVMEARSLDYFIEIVVAMADAAAEHAPELQRGVADDERAADETQPRRSMEPGSSQKGSPQRPG